MADPGIRFQRTHDLHWVAGVFTLPGIWEWIGDDYAPERWAFQPNEDPRIMYVFCEECGQRVGLFTFLPQNWVCWEVHIILLSNSDAKRRTRGHVILRGALEWMFGHSTAQRIVGAVPAYNRLALKVAERAGMKLYGINPRSFMKHGKLEDQWLYGTSKEEPCLPS